MGKWATLHKGAFFLSYLIFPSILWGPYSTSIDCNTNRKKVSPDFTPKCGREGKRCKGKQHCRGKKLLESKFLRQETEIIQATRQLESISRRSDRTLELQRPPGSTTVQGRQRTHPSWTSLRQKAALEPPFFVKQQIDFRTELAFVPTPQIHFGDLKRNSLFSHPRFSQPWSLRSCQAVLWRMALCPAQAFWRTAGAMLFSPGEGMIQQGRCWPCSCPIPPCASCRKGRSTQTCLSNFVMPLKPGVLQAAESAPWILGKTTNV